MSKIPLIIDGKEIEAEEGISVLEAARAEGFDIPNLCHHDKLESYGACRICTVEAEKNGRSKLVVSCVYPVEKGLVVTTRSEKVDRARRLILELLLSHAPDSEQLRNLADEYGANKDRFEKEPSFCIHCGLCVRYCAEVKGKHAVGFINRGSSREINFIPELVASECWNCKECFPLCPTSALQAAYVFTAAQVSEAPVFEDDTD